jgi:hypothetical protein
MHLFRISQLFFVRPTILSEISSVAGDIVVADPGRGSGVVLYKYSVVD